MKQPIAHILLPLTLSPLVHAQAAESLNARMLHRASQLLADESYWNRADAGECTPHGVKLSLYCALSQATEALMGQPVHRTTAMEEVRRVIQQKGRERI